MELFGNLEIYSPGFLWLLVLVPPVFYFLFRKRFEENPYLQFSFLSFIRGRKTFRNYFQKGLPFLFTFILLLMIVSMTRPRSVDVSKHVNKIEGVDIILAVDVSASMLAKDLKPNRLEALKRTAVEFVSNRPGDRIGVVLYAGEAFTQVPLTSDKRIVINAIKDIDFFKLFRQIEQGTAIGMGLATAVSRLKDSNAKSKVIILMTDGVNNTGAVDPETALELAKEFGIKVYTIGLGTNGIAPFPVLWENGQITFQNQRVEIDEKLLKKIARETGGKYYRATDNKKLEEIYREIDKLEKSIIEELKYYNYRELYRYLLLPALLLFLLSWIGKNIVLKSVV